LPSGVLPAQPLRYDQALAAGWPIAGFSRMRPNCEWAPRKPLSPLWLMAPTI